MKQFSRILLIDTTLHKCSATGITLSNLFGGWPKDLLFMVGDQLSVKLSIEAGYRGTYQLNANDYYHKFPLGLVLLLYRTLSGWVRKMFFNVELNSTRTDKSSEIESNRFSIKNYFQSLFQYLGLDHLLFRQVISKELRQWINTHNPDYFYAVLSSRHSILFARNLVSEFRKPIVVHIMDDWPTTIGSNCLFYRYWNRKINDELNSLIKISYKRIAISELMAIEFGKRYSANWSYYHNPVDTSFWRPITKRKLHDSSNFTILYSGRLSTGINETIKLVSAAVDDINHTTDFKVTFRIQSGMAPSWIDSFKSTVFSKSIDYDLLPNLFSSVDLLLLPYDFFGKSFELIRISIPSKLKEYMASGTPILIVAPSNTALSDYALKSNFGHVVNSNNTSHIKENILYLLENENLLAHYSKRSLRLVNESFEISKVQKSFQELFFIV